MTVITGTILYLLVVLTLVWGNDEDSLLWQQWNSQQQEQRDSDLYQQHQRHNRESEWQNLYRSPC
jgi:hypothetical protein